MISKIAPISLRSEYINHYKIMLYASNNSGLYATRASAKRPEDPLKRHEAPQTASNTPSRQWNRRSFSPLLRIRKIPLPVACQLRSVTLQPINLPRHRPLRMRRDAPRIHNRMQAIRRMVIRHMRSSLPVNATRPRPILAAPPNNAPIHRAQHTSFVRPHMRHPFKIAPVHEPIHALPNRRTITHRFLASR